MRITREHCIVYGAIVAAYAIYLICHVAAGQLVPDGLILSGIVGVGAAIAGVQYGNQAKRPPEGHDE